MEAPVLTDKNQFPSEEIIFSHLGQSKKIWRSIFELIQTEFPSISKSWKYYIDGKSWLLKLSSKSKTICWVSVIKKAFRMTFYFTSKADGVIAKSDLPIELKKHFQKEKRTKKLIGLTVIIKTKKDLDSARQLIELKFMMN